MVKRRGEVTMVVGVGGRGDDGATYVEVAIAALEKVDILVEV